MCRRSIILFGITTLCSFVASNGFGIIPKRNARKVEAKRSSKRQKQFIASSKNNHHASIPPLPTTATFADSNTKLSYAVSAALPRLSNFRIFCDMDGVLCDFDAGVRALSQGVPADVMNKKRMWRLIGKADRFYDRLAWTKDGRRLWDAIRHLSPDILTGVPAEHRARTEKFSWCRRELGVDVNHVDMAGSLSRHKVVKGSKRRGITNVITCWSRNKHFESGEKAVLIDDRIDLAYNWEAKGGIFIHHTETEKTLKQLKEHGIIPTESEEASSRKKSLVAEN